MNIDHPTSAQIPALKKLWLEAFGDPEDYVERFFRLAFQKDHCLCISSRRRLWAALYWLEAGAAPGETAYLYAVATDPAHRGQGCFHRLMATAEDHLKARGYKIIALVPGTDQLWGLYQSLGYVPFSPVRREEIQAGGTGCSLEPLTWQDYAGRRAALLPAGALPQEPVALALMAPEVTFWQGPGFLCIACGDRLPEYLGDPGMLPQAVRALDRERMTVLFPGGGENRGLCKALQPSPMPTYLGLPLD